jgi:hypothetical protein
MRSDVIHDDRRDAAASSDIVTLPGETGVRSFASDLTCRPRDQAAGNGLRSCVCKVVRGHVHKGGHVVQFAVHAVGKSASLNLSDFVAV